MTSPEQPTTNTHTAAQLAPPLTIIPIIYGNTTVTLPDQSICWTLYLRHAKSANCSLPFLSHVKFQLHESFGDKQFITLNTPPYQVTLTGWGEFEAQIHLYRKTHDRKPFCTLHHLVRLFGVDGDEVNQVVSEVYDELIMRVPNNNSQHANDYLPIEDERIPREIDIEPVRRHIVPKIIEREIKTMAKRGVKVQFTDELRNAIHGSDEQRLRVLEELRLKSIGRARENVEKAIRLMERKVRELEAKLADEERDLDENGADGTRTPAADKKEKNTTGDVE